MTTLSGTLTRADTGGPLEGAFVALYDLSAVFIAFDTTAADGTYAVPVPAGSYKVIVQPNDPAFGVDMWYGGPNFILATEVGLQADRSLDLTIEYSVTRTPFQSSSSVDIAGARSELVAALIAAGIRGVKAPLAEPPYAFVTRDGVAAARIVAGQVDATYTVRLVSGAFDSEAAADALDADLQTTLQVIRELDGWTVGPVGPDQGRDYQGATYLTADVATSRRVDIT